MNKEYLGDSVYVEIKHGMLMLTTENGDGPSNTIGLEPELFDKLVAYHERAVEHFKALREANQSL